MTLSNYGARKLGIGVLLFCLMGCGDGRPQTYPVEGSVRFENGQPVTFGSVEFRSPELRFMARSKIDSQGRFALSTFVNEDGAVAGEHQVVVTQSVSPSALPSGGEHARQHGHQLQLVALRYADYRTSDLKAVVEAKAQNRIELRVTAR